MKNIEATKSRKVCCEALIHNYKRTSWHPDLGSGLSIVAGNTNFVQVYVSRSNKYLRCYAKKERGRIRRWQLTFKHESLEKKYASGYQLGLKMKTKTAANKSFLLGCDNVHVIKVLWRGAVVVLKPSKKHKFLAEQHHAVTTPDTGRCSVFECSIDGLRSVSERWWDGTTHTL